MSKIWKELVGYLSVLVIVIIPVLIWLLFSLTQYGFYADTKMVKVGEDSCYYIGSDIGGYTPVLKQDGSIDCGGSDE